VVASGDYLSSVQRGAAVSESDLPVIELVNLRLRRTDMKTLFASWILGAIMLFTFTLTAAPTPAEAQVVVKVGPQHRHYRHYRHHYYYQNHHRYYR
jgi:hypothetical protein